jgi:hypothetical protein
MIEKTKIFREDSVKIQKGLQANGEAAGTML